MTRTPAIEIRQLSAGYGGLPVIEGIDLTVPPDGYLGIIGPNGGGKTTLLKSILGLLPPIRGAVRIFGADPISGRLDVGYVPQYPEFDHAFPISVWDVVLMGRRARRGLAPGWAPEDRRAAEQALEQVQMIDHRTDRIGDLSGGQSQRIYIARALAAQARILLLDEPTASVDSRIQESVYELLSELNRDVAIVLVTHDVGVISSHVKQIACLNHRLYTHGDQTLTADMLEQAYQCPVDLIAHGVPHRVLSHHHDDGCGEDCVSEPGEGDPDDPGHGPRTPDPGHGEPT